MKKYLLMIITSLLLIQGYSVFGATYDIKKVDSENVICATGNQLNGKIDIMGLDLDGCDYVITVLELDGTPTSTLGKINEYGYTISTFDKMTKGKEYTCYVITYKDGVATYSNKNVFKYGE